ncbi:transcription termination factor Rho [Nocardioides cavernaquae]|uniref:Transcription termination factor Rho n=1 Tax=Nocardioides cavernaquae TaxID=2321396 RepID=A0A3A5HG57_9ACTN|nr:transcription termination factor Rho [Nocardioides cavernaquae]RJS46890.1 transcription termination factor Rho [Nocardioides cavernaquae]
MTETIEGPAAAKKRSGSLNALLLADLKSMAGGLGIAGAASMKKADLITAIKGAQSGAASAAAKGDEATGTSSERPPKAARAPRAAKAATAAEPAASAEPAERPERTEPNDRENASESSDEPAPPRNRNRNRNRDAQQGNQADADQGNQQDARHDTQQDASQESAGEQGGNREGNQRGQNQPNQRGQQGNQQGRQGDQQPRQNQPNQNQPNQNQPNQGNQAGQNQASQDGPDGEGTGNRRRRGRDRERTPGAPGQRARNEPDTTILEDDVLVPAAGILDVLDNYAFVRTSGYLPGTEDVYLSLSMVRKFGLRRGDAIVGQVRQPREGERKEKFNPMVRIDSVNGLDPESAKDRVEFSKLTPLYPTERLRLETDKDNMIGRVIDIAAPIGKGQRGLIVSPAKAGKTMVMQSIANSITANNPECHLMVVLVDERPEEVTDFQRSVKGEVISSTFDRPATDHTLVAELAIERAKRLVELGHDVVVLLDGITRLGRAYNLAAPPSGRILSGGVDSAALYPPKKFFGAARNIENGGSLTILATALIESGSKMDEVIFEEFKGTGNMEIRLRRDFADKRLFPAIDVVSSGTRREELLMSPEEQQIIWKLRRVMAGLDGQQALELLLERLKKSQSNVEFLMQVAKTTPSQDHAG